MACEGVNVTGPIFITKYAGRQDTCCDCIGTGYFPAFNDPRTTEIRNILDATVDVNVPVERYAIPESTDDKAIIIKALGNHTTIQLSWIIHSETTNIVLQCLAAAPASESCPAKGGVSNGCTKSINNQLKWWTNVFQSNSIEDRYHIYIGDCTTNPIPNKPPANSGCPPSGGTAEEVANIAASEAYNKDGTLQNFRASLTGDAPVTYKATATFFVGTPQATTNEDFLQ